MVNKQLARAAHTGHFHGVRPLARRAHLPVVRVGQILRGEVQPRADEKTRIARAVGVPVGRLFPADVDSDVAVR